MKSIKGQLVCRHLENLSRKALEQYQDVIKEYVHGRHGIYALYMNNRLYYVGLASNLSSRLKNHLHDRHAQTWDRFSIYLTADGEHMRDLETLVLKIASPKGNKLSGAFVSSKNMMQDFKRDIKDKHKRELNSLVGVKEQKAVPKLIKKVSSSDGGPILAKYTNTGFKIRMTYKGKLYKATVRKDGSIAYKGRVYNSPSLAAVAVTGKPSNGWVWWKYQRGPGDWVLLDELRKKNR